jgi:transcriptional regulator with XRE-family HTH domain
MDLRQIFILNLRTFRKKEGISQMKLADRCNTSASYIGEIEIGRKFPSVEMIDKMAKALRIDAYHLFVDRTSKNNDPSLENGYPQLPRSMKDELIIQFNASIATILDQY